MQRITSSLAHLVRRGIWPTSLVLLIALCLVVAQTTMAVEPPLKIGFLFVGPISDMGWNYEQNRGRQYVESHLGKNVETTFAENVGESAEAERVMEKMIAQGAKLIIASSFGYLEPVMRCAKKHPNVVFMQLNRVGDAPNVGTYVSRHCEPMYLAGIAAGRMTKVNKIGFVASHPVPSTFQTLDGLVLGIHSVNPKAKVNVVWTNQWIDPPTEAEAAKGLIEMGVDVLGFDQSDSTTIVKSAEKSKVFVVGNYSDAHQLAPKEWITGNCFNWGPYYTQVAQQVIDHKWHKSVDLCDLKSGAVKLSEFGPAVPKAVRDEVLQVKHKLETGQLEILQGPIKDRDGKVRLAAGQKADSKWLEDLNFLVPGIEGPLPNK
jgi:basic membrane protein A and related proteins